MTPTSKAPPPTTPLDALRAEPNDAERVRAANVYIIVGQAKLTEARTIRDAALRLVAEQHGPTAAARLTGVSVALAKLALR